MYSLGQPASRAARRRAALCNAPCNAPCNALWNALRHLRVSQHAAGQGQAAHVDAKRVRAPAHRAAAAALLRRRVRLRRGHGRRCPERPAAAHPGLAAVS